MRHPNFHAISGYTYHGYVTPVQASRYLRLASMPVNRLTSWLRSVVSRAVFRLLLAGSYRLSYTEVAEGFSWQALGGKVARKFSSGR